MKKSGPTVAIIVFFILPIIEPSLTKRAHAQAKRGTIAFKPLEPIGLPKVQVDRMDTTLQKIFMAIPGARLLPLKTIKKFVRKSKGRRLLGCGAEKECVFDFGKALKTPFVIAGDMTTVGRGFALSLKLIDIKNKKTLGKVSAVITGNKYKQKKALLELGYRLLAPNKHLGKVAVLVDVRGAKIFVDGEHKATYPAKILSLKAGAHNIRVTHPSYHDYLKFISLPFQKTLTLKVNLKAYPIISDSMEARKRKTGHLKKRKTIYRPLPWYKKWYVVTAIGVGAALLAGTATALGVALSENSHLKRDLTVTLRP